MSVPVEIIDGGGSGRKAKVTKNLQLVTAPISYDEVANAEVNASGTGFVLFIPKQGKQFVITTILLTAKKTVTTDEIVDIYEANSADSAVIDKSIMQVEMLKNSFRDFIGLNLIVGAGKWVTVKADDATTLVTCMGYYINAL